MSSGTRASTRASVHGTAADKGGASRARAPGHDGHKERPDPRKHAASPQPPGSGTAHKRSASGNFVRPASRAVDERRTERVQVTTRETLVSRTRSPERRSAASERSRTTDGAKQKPAAESRPREIRPEPVLQGTWQN